jgi:hypothetical protein
MFKRFLKAKGVFIMVMDLKNEFQNLLIWGLQNEQNKKKLIQMLSLLIIDLNLSDKKALSEEELRKISGFSRRAY